MSDLDKVQDKLTVPVAVIADHDLDLKSIWLADRDRDWSGVYSRETFRRFWDDRYSVERCSR